MPDNQQHFLGLDLGTTNIKAMLVNASGQILARGKAPVKMFDVGAKGMEQDIEDIFSATIEALAQLRTQADVSNVCAVGISSQGAAMQPLDSAGRCVGRVISWLDARGAPYDEELTRSLGGEYFSRHVGHGSSSLAVGQILRLTREGMFNCGAGILPARDGAGSTPAIARFGFVGDLVVGRLTGRGAHDATSLSICGLYNPATRGMDEDLLRRLGVSAWQLPDLISPREPAGLLKKDTADQLGLPEGIPVSAAVHDQYAAALGSGACRAGDVNFGSGTAWVLLAAAPSLTQLAIPEAFLSTSVVEDLYGQLLSMGNGGSSFAWAVRTLNLGAITREQIDALMSAIPAGSAGLRFRPLLATGARGRLDGIGLMHTPGHVLRSVVEGLAMELNRHLRMIVTAGNPVARLVMCGTAAASAVTPQVIADATGTPISCPQESETSALGAAMLARGLIERDLRLEEISDQMIQPSRTYLPGPDATLYRELFQQYMKSLPTI